MTSVATLKRDISLMERDGLTVVLRGRRKRRRVATGGNAASSEGGMEMPVSGNGR
jgi:hypothetical protein